jgi:hypothetical protein
MISYDTVASRRFAYTHTDSFVFPFFFADVCVGEGQEKTINGRGLLVGVHAHTTQNNNKETHRRRDVPSSPTCLFLFFFRIWISTSRTTTRSARLTAVALSVGPARRGAFLLRGSACITATTTNSHGRIKVIYVDLKHTYMHVYG